MNGSPRNTPTDKGTEELLTLVANVLAGLKMCWKFVQNLRASTVQQITYAGLVADIVNKKPDDPYIKRCSVLRNPCPDGSTELVIVYLDDLNHPGWGPNPERPFGWKMKTKKLDQELLEAFGNNNMLILD